LSRRRTTLLATLAFVVASPLAPAAADPSIAPAAVSADGAGVTATVPTIAYGPRDDRFRIGPFSSRLHVLFNDTGVPAPRRLQLLDRRGIPTPKVTVARLGRLRVVAGYVVMDPVPGARGHLSFTYRAASPNGPPANARVVVELFRRVIVAANDRATTGPRTSVPVDVAANDRLLVAGAVTACAPQLFAHPPRRPDPLPLVLPEPARRPIDCVGRDRRRTLTGPHGTWRLDAEGRVVFSPAAGFTGTVRAYYRQASDYPFDLAVAGVSVLVGQRGTAVLGNKTGSHAGRAGGPLAATGAVVILLAFAGGLLLMFGLILVRAAARRRRQPIDLEA
jgi:hypothetical protein